MHKKEVYKLIADSKFDQLPDDMSEHQIAKVNEQLDHIQLLGEKKIDLVKATKEKEGKKKARRKASRKRFKYPKDQKKK